MPYSDGGGRTVNWRLTVPLLVVVIAYVILGAAIFYFLEAPSRRTHENAKRKVLREFLESYPDVTQARVLELLNNFSREVYLSSEQMHTYDLTHVTGENIHNWDFGTAVYFVVTVITTIGYGDVVPVSSEGRIFCCVYALIGIPTCLVLLANVGGALYIVIKRIDNKVDCLRRNPRRAQAVRCVALFSIGLCFFVLLPSYMFSVVEEWGFANSVYYAFITLSTVGLGDFVADIGTSGRSSTPWYLAVLVFWLFLGLAWLSTTISSTQELITELLREDSSKSAEEDNPAPTAQTLATTGRSIKTISQRSLDSQLTMETTVAASPFPPYLSDEQYPTPELLSHYTASANSGAASRGHQRTLTYKGAHVVSSTSTTPPSGVVEKEEKGNKEESSIGWGRPMETKEEPVDDQCSSAVHLQGSHQDKGVQVNLTSMKSLHDSVHAPPTGVARIYPLADRQSHIPPANNGDITLVTRSTDSGKTAMPDVSNIPNFGDNKEESMWW